MIKAKLTPEERKAIGEFLFSQKGFTREQYEPAYQNWFRGGRGWDVLHQGGTGQMIALMWYQNRFKSYSREWRPRIIIEALKQQIGE